MYRHTILSAVLLLTITGRYLESTQTPSRLPEAEQLLFQATNEFRVKNKLRPLVWDQRLSDIAYAHSAGMIVRSFFDHMDPDGRSPTERIHRQHRQFIGNTGENLSVVVGSPPLSPALISEQVMSGWQGSPPHRANILDLEFTHVGMGVAFSGVEAKVTQNFMQVRGILKEPVPEVLGPKERLKLEVVSFPEDTPKAKKYVLAPLGPVSQKGDPPVWALSETRPLAAPGRYAIQFCFPIPRSNFFEVFPGPEIQIVK